jgi:hypothetical protein
VQGARTPPRSRWSLGCFRAPTCQPRSEKEKLPAVGCCSTVTCRLDRRPLNAIERRPVTEAWVITSEVKEFSPRSRTKRRAKTTRRWGRQGNDQVSGWGRPGIYPTMACCLVTPAVRQKSLSFLIVDPRFLFGLGLFVTKRIALLLGLALGAKLIAIVAIGQ